MRTWRSEQPCTQNFARRAETIHTSTPILIAWPGVQPVALGATAAPSIVSTSADAIDTVTTIRVARPIARTTDAVAVTAHIITSSAEALAPIPIAHSLAAVLVACTIRCTASADAVA